MARGEFPALDGRPRLAALVFELRRWVNRADLTHAALARRAALSVSTIAGVLSGARWPTSQTMVAILQACDCESYAELTDVNTLWEQARWERSGLEEAGNPEQASDPAEFAATLRAFLLLRTGTINVRRIADATDSQTSKSAVARALSGRALPSVSLLLLLLRLGTPGDAALEKRWLAVRGRLRGESVPVAAAMVVNDNVIVDPRLAGSPQHDVAPNVVNAIHESARIKGPVIQAQHIETLTFSESILRRPSLAADASLVMGMLRRELVTLRRGAGVQRTRLEVGPVLRQVSQVQADASQHTVRSAVISTLRAATELLPEQVSDLVLVALNVAVPSKWAPNAIYSERLEMLGLRLEREPRTASRRVDDALARVAEVLAHHYVIGEPLVDIPEPEVVVVSGEFVGGGEHDAQEEAR